MKNSNPDASIPLAWLFQKEGRKRRKKKKKKRLLRQNNNQYVNTVACPQKRFYWRLYFPATLWMSQTAPTFSSIFTVSQICREPWNEEDFADVQIKIRTPCKFLEQCTFQTDLLSFHVLIFQPLGGGGLAAFWTKGSPSSPGTALFKS